MVLKSVQLYRRSESSCCSLEGLEDISMCTCILVQNFSLKKLYCSLEKMNIPVECKVMIKELFFAGLHQLLLAAFGTEWAYFNHSIHEYYCAYAHQDTPHPVIVHHVPGALNMDIRLHCEFSDTRAPDWI